MSGRASAVVGHGVEDALEPVAQGLALPRAALQPLPQEIHFREAGRRGRGFLVAGQDDRGIGPDLRHDGELPRLRHTVIAQVHKAAGF